MNQATGVICGTGFGILTILGHKKQNESQISKICKKVGRVLGEPTQKVREFSQFFSISYQVLSRFEF